MVKLSITVFGNVLPSVADNIIETIRESYDRMGQPMTQPVGVELFESQPGAVFFATHNIWQGKSLISIYVDKFLTLPPLVGIGGLRRQVAHSILHGSMEFYLLKLPEELLKAVVKYKLPWSYAHSLIYGIAMTAKEYEVTGLLYSKGFVDDQVAYAQYILKPTGEDLFSWELASRDRGERALHLLSLIRDVGPFMPLIKEEVVGKCIEERLAILPPIYQSRLKEVIHKWLPLLGTDTMANIDLITKRFVEEILSREYGG